MGVGSDRPVSDNLKERSTSDTVSMGDPNIGKTTDPQEMVGNTKRKRTESEDNDEGGSLKQVRLNLFFTIPKSCGSPTAVLTKRGMGRPRLGVQGHVSKSTTILPQQSDVPVKVKRVQIFTTKLSNERHKEYLSILPWLNVRDVDVTDDNGEAKSLPHMFCGLCEERFKRGQKRNSFTTGCGLLRKDSVVKHVKSWHYSDLVSKTKTISTSSIQSGLKTMEDTEKKRGCTLIGQCFSVAKLDDSLHSFSKRLDVLEYQ